MVQKTAGVRQGYCRDCTAALMGEPRGGTLKPFPGLQPSDETTNETTSHPARLPIDDSLVIANNYSTGETACHSTRLSKNDNQVSGYGFC